jgi:hypothetical protein
MKSGIIQKLAIKVRKPKGQMKIGKNMDLKVFYFVELDLDI